MNIPEGKKIYFASDFHMGAPDLTSSRLREQQIVSWLDFAARDAAEIYLVGDVFDFWFEYARVIPKGFARLQGKLAEITDAGIPVHFFSGNHDMWGLDYFKDELGLILHRDPISVNYNGKDFYIGHGDGLGPGDSTYKMLKKIFRNPLCQWLFARIHPNLGVGIASGWSNKSRARSHEEEVFQGMDKEWLAIYAREVLQRSFYDYFIFGHRHLPLDLLLDGKSRYINLGEWMTFRSYAVFDGTKLGLEYWNKDIAPTLAAMPKIS